MNKRSESIYSYLTENTSKLSEIFGKFEMTIPRYEAKEPEGMDKMTAEIFLKNKDFSNTERGKKF